MRQRRRKRPRRAAAPHRRPLPSGGMTGSVARCALAHSLLCIRLLFLSFYPCPLTHSHIHAYSHINALSHTHTYTRSLTLTLTLTLACTQNQVSPLPDPGVLEQPKLTLRRRITNSVLAKAASLSSLRKVFKGKRTASRTVCVYVCLYVDLHTSHKSQFNTFISHALTRRRLRTTQQRP